MSRKVEALINGASMDAKDSSRAWTLDSQSFLLTEPQEKLLDGYENYLNIRTTRRKRTFTKECESTEVKCDRNIAEEMSLALDEAMCMER